MKNTYIVKIRHGKSVRFLSVDAHSRNDVPDMVETHHGFSRSEIVNVQIEHDAAFIAKCSRMERKHRRNMKRAA